MGIGPPVVVGTQAALFAGPAKDPSVGAVKLNCQFPASARLLLEELLEELPPQPQSPTKLTNNKAKHALSDDTQRTFAATS
jgi:hypothetical protein